MNQEKFSTTNNNPKREGSTASPSPIQTLKVSETLDVVISSGSLSFRAAARNLLHDGAQISPRGVYPARASAAPSVNRDGTGAGTGEPCRRARRNDKNKKVWTRKPQFQTVFKKTKNWRNNMNLKNSHEE
jgi:hypothetical protein